MRIFLPLLIMYGGNFALLTLMTKHFTVKLAFFAAILTAIMMAFFAAISLLVDQGFYWTQFALPVLAIGLLYSIYKIGAIMARHLNKGN